VVDRLSRIFDQLFDHGPRGVAPPGFPIRRSMTSIFSARAAAHIS
jgi:hypothetical protein